MTMTMESMPLAFVDGGDVPGPRRVDAGGSRGPGPVDVPGPARDVVEGLEARGTRRDEAGGGQREAVLVEQRHEAGGVGVPPVLVGQLVHRVAVGLQEDVGLAVERRGQLVSDRVEHEAQGRAVHRGSPLYVRPSVAVLSRP
jgi:hypothetical protein